MKTFSLAALLTAGLFLFPVSGTAFLSAKSLGSPPTQDFSGNRENPSLLQFSQVDTFSTQRNVVLKNIQRGQFEEAEIILREVVRQDPQHPEALRLLADVLRFQKKFDEAVQFYSRLIEIYPENMDFRVGRGRSYLALQKFEKAKSDFQYIAKNDPTHPGGKAGLEDTAKFFAYETELKNMEEWKREREGLLNQAQKFEADKNFPAMVKTYQKILGLNPEDTETRLRLARAFRLNSQYEKAETLDLELLEQIPDSPDILTELGYLSLYNKKYRASLEYLGRAQSLDPKNKDAQEGWEKVFSWLKENKPEVIRDYKEQGIVAVLSRAKASITAGDFTSAESALKQAAHDYPGDNRILFHLARSLVFQKKYDQGIALLNDLIEQYPSNLDYWLMRGRTFWFAGNLGPAESDFKQILSVESAHREAQEGLERIQNARAQKEIELARQRDKEFVQDRLTVASRKEKAMDLAGAAAIYQEIIGRYSDHFDARVRLARVYRGLGKSQESLQIYEELLKEHPENADLWTAMGFLQMQRSQYDQARKSFSESLRLNPGQFDPLLGMAQIHRRHRQFDEAESIYTQIKDKYPHLPNGELELLRLKAWKGKHSDAEQGLKELLARYPNHFDLLVLLGQVTAWQLKYQDSIDYYKKALSIRPDDIEAIRGLATTYKWMKKTQEGIALYARMLERDPNNVDGLMGTGILYSQAGNNKEAIVFLEKARELAPERADVRAMLGTLYSWNARLDDAVTELQKSVALERGDISNYIALGRIFRWQKKKEESIKLYRKALEIDPENTEALVGLGRVYLYDDEWDKAEELYLKAQKLKPNDLDVKEALAQLKRIKAPVVNFRYNFFQSRLHDPATGKIDTTFIDHRETLESFFKLSPKTTLQIRFQHAERRQLALSNTVTDFNVETNTASIGLFQKLPQDFSVHFRFDWARFHNDNILNSASNLRKSESEFSGFFILTKKLDRHLWRMTVARELFVSPNPGFASVENINTYSLSYDVGHTENFSTLMVVSVNDNSNFSKLQQDHVLRARYRLPGFRKIQFEYQFRYLSNPDTYQNTMGFNFQNQLGSKVRYEFNYFLTQSHNTLDNFLRNSFKFFYSWDILPWLSWSADAILTLDTLNGNLDTVQNYQTYLTFRF